MLWAAMKLSGEGGGADAFYDAEDGQGQGDTIVPLCKMEHFAPRSRAAALKHRVRMSTDFPEQEPSETVGPWRTTEVERHTQVAAPDDGSGWLLVGRRHSVDDRRGALEQGKTVFLRSLAEKADGLWRRRVAARADLLQQVEERVEAELTTQAQALKAANSFWAERYSADMAYAERLEACGAAPAGTAAALPLQQACAQSEWRACMQKNVESSGAWAQQLPELLASHEKSAAEIRRAIRRAVADTEAASKSVRDARAAVWPAGAVRAAPSEIFGSQGADSGPGRCLWLAVRSYLLSCGGLHSAQSAALARVRRESQKLAQLAAWVDEALGRERGESVSTAYRSRGASDASYGSGGAASAASSLPELVPEGKTKSRSSDPEDEGESSEDSDDEVLDASMDLSLLAVHEQDIEVRGALDEPWAPSRLLFTVDLWLHIWMSSDEAMPTRSISLTSECLRPVADHSPEEPRVLQLRFRPPVDEGYFASLSSKWRGSSKEQERELWIRCADNRSADELVGVLELVEKLYPVLE